MNFFITNYRRLEEDRVYLVLDSLDEFHLLHYRGYFYCEDWYEDALVFWKPGHEADSREWPSCEFKGAYLIEDESTIPTLIAEHARRYTF